MSKTEQTKLPAMTQVRRLEVGETVYFPLEGYISIRANLNAYSMNLGRRWTTHIDRKAGKFSVTRIQ